MDLADWQQPNPGDDTEESIENINEFLQRLEVDKILEEHSSNDKDETQPSKSENTEESDKVRNDSPDKSTASVPEILVTQDPVPANWRTLYDDETSSDEDREGNDETNSMNSKSKTELEQELNKTKDRLIDEISRTDKLQEKLNKAKQVTESFESKLQFVSADYKLLLEKNQKQDELIKGLRSELAEMKSVHKEHLQEINDAKPEENEEILTLQQLVSDLRQELQDLEAAKNTELNESIQQYESYKALKEDEIEELNKCVDKLNKELAKERESNRLLSNISNGYNSEWPRNSDLDRKAVDSSDETSEQIVLQEKIKELEEKLINQEELKKKIMTLQQESIDLRSTMNNQQRKYEEALDTLELVHQSFTARNKLLEQEENSAGKQKLGHSNANRENPEGQSSDSKSGIQDAEIQTNEEHDDRSQKEEEDNLNAVVKIELLMKALQKSQSETDLLQSQIEMLQNELNVTKESSRERAKKVNELQREILDLRDTNKAVKTKLEFKETKLEEMIEEIKKMENDLLEAKKKLDKEERLMSEKASLEIALEQTKGKLRISKEKLKACKRELKKAEQEHKSNVKLIASIPRLHEKISNADKRIQQLQDIIKAKEDAERQRLEEIENEKRRAAKEKLKQRRELESRIIGCNYVEDSVLEPSLMNLEGQEGVNEMQKEIQDSDKILKNRPRSAETSFTQLDNHGLQNPGRQFSKYRDFRARSAKAFDNHKAGNPEYVVNHHTPLFARRENGKMHWKSLSSPGSFLDKSMHPLPFQPRVLVWGMEKEEPARKVVAINDRVLVEVGPFTGTNRETLTMPAVVKFIGPVGSKEDEIRIGLKLDEPVGEHDGKLDGIRYFRCEPFHGIFVKLEEILRVLNPKQAHLSKSPRDIVT